MNLKTLTQLLLLGAACPGLALAQAAEQTRADTDKPRWYQVEMAVFARDTWQAQNEEAWPAQQQLQYPGRLVVLSPPAANTPDEASASAGEPHNDGQLGNGRHQPQPGGEAATPAPFLLLQDDEMELRSAVRRITSKRKYRLLFHEIWQQPMYPRDQADSLLIRGGEQYDDHFELEGYVTLAVERYLHITTDLWYSQFMAYTGQDSQWQMLPTPPVGQTLDETGDLNRGAAETPMDFSAPAVGINTFNSPFEQFIRRNYVAERTVVLRQHRRMRSGELHYIDHPMLGLLVKVTPITLEPPAPEEPSADDLLDDLPSAGVPATPTAEP